MEDWAAGTLMIIEKKKFSYILLTKFLYEIIKFDIHPSV